MAVHDARLGRQDPDGLLVAERDGLAGRADVAATRRTTSRPATTPTRTGTASSRPDGGLLNPNHFLAVAIEYLYTHRDGWAPDAAVGKTLVSSSMIDRVAESPRPAPRRGAGRLQVVRPRPARRVGRRSAARSRRARRSCAATAASGRPTRTACCSPCSPRRSSRSPGRPPSEHYRSLTGDFGDPAYARVDAPATREEKAVLASLSPEQVTATELAGEPIVAKLTEAPGNGAKIGGLKVTTESAWFAARPSGTEDVYKIYAESFRGADHLREVQAAAREVVSAALGRVGRARAAADHDRAPAGRDLRRPAGGRAGVRAARLRRVLPVRPPPAHRRRRPRPGLHRRLGRARRAGPRHHAGSGSARWSRRRRSGCRVRWRSPSPPSTR